MSGLREGELTLSSLENQLTAVVGSIHRHGQPMQILDLGLAEEKHQNPAHPKYDTHFHVILRVSSRLDHSSSKFDPIGVSGSKLRAHITVPESDEHWANQIRYLLKDGRCTLRLTDASALTFAEQPPSNAAAAKWAESLKVACKTQGITALEAVDSLKEKHFEEWVVHYDKALQAAHRIIGSHQPAVRKSVYTH